MHLNVSKRGAFGEIGAETLPACTQNRAEDGLVVNPNRGVDGRRIMMRRSGFCLAENEEAQAYFKELCEYFCCVDYNGQNRWTHPPVNGGAPEDLMEETTKYGTNFNTENRYSDGDTAEGN